MKIRYGININYIIFNEIIIIMTHNFMRKPMRFRIRNFSFDRTRTQHKSLLFACLHAIHKNYPLRHIMF